MTNKQLLMPCIHVNKIHANLGHTGEDNIGETQNHLDYRIKGVVEVYKYWCTEKSKHNALGKLV